MSRIRTFVAAEISRNVRDRAAELIERLRHTGTNVKWVDPDNLHFTLNFLGDVDEREVNAVCRKVADAVADVATFDIQCAGLGAFPNVDRPRTIWLGVERGSDEMCVMQDAIASALVDLGFRKERRAFRPHLTLGRVRRGGHELRDLSRMLKAEAGFDAGAVAIDEAVVFASRLEPTGPVHQAMSRAELGSVL